MIGRRKGIRRMADKIIRGYYMHMVPDNCIVDSIGKFTHEPLVMLHPWISAIGLSASPLHPPPHPPPQLAPCAGFQSQQQEEAWVDV